MGIGSSVDKLVKIEKVFKKGLDEEIKFLEDIHAEIITGLKQARAVISQTRFESLSDENKDNTLDLANQAIVSFSSSLNPLVEQFDGRFLKLQEHVKVLKKALYGLKDTLSVYNSSKKAVIDFDSNIAYEFEVTLLRDLEQHIALNKKIIKELS